MRKTCKAIENHPQDSRVKLTEDGIVQTLSSRMGTGGGNVPMLLEGSENMEDEMVVRRLTPTECERLQGYPDDWTLIGEPVDEEIDDFFIEYEFNKEVSNGFYNVNQIGKTKIGSHIEKVYYYKTEDGKRKKVTDSARYKALGNSIALPQWKWLAERMQDYLPEGSTLGSLFDGIAGFPLVWESTYGEHTARWSSEIEEFPIMVCTQHFGDEDKGIEGDLYK